MRPPGQDGGKQGDAVQVRDTPGGAQGQGRAETLRHDDQPAVARRPEDVGSGSEAVLPDAQACLEVRRIERIARSRIVEAQACDPLFRQLFGKHAPELARAYLLQSPGTCEKHCGVGPLAVLCRRHEQAHGIRENDGKRSVLLLRRGHVVFPGAVHLRDLLFTDNADRVLIWSKRPHRRLDSFSPFRAH